MDPLLEPPPTRRPPRPARPPVRRMVWWSLLFFSGMLAVTYFPQEVSYWYLAAAMKSAEEGRQAEALALVDQAEKWTPEEMLPQRVRLTILAKSTSLDDLLAAYDQVLRLDPPNQIKASLHGERFGYLHAAERYEEALAAYDAEADYVHHLRPSIVRVELLLRLWRRDEAERELSQVIAKQGKSWDWATIGSGSMEDNNIAYFSALLERDLDDALTRINRSLDKRGDDAASLDTRGFVLYRRGEHALAWPDLNKAVELAQKELEGTKSPILKKALEKGLVVLLYHRSLVLDSLGKSSQAEADRVRVRELGFEPDDRLF